MEKKRLEFVLNDQVEVVADYLFFFSFRHCRVFLSNSRDIRDTQQMACSSLSLPQAARTAPAASTKCELRGC